MSPVTFMLARPLSLSHWLLCFLYTKCSHDPTIDFTGFDSQWLLLHYLIFLIFWLLFRGIIQISVLFCLHLQALAVNHLGYLSCSLFIITCVVMFSARGRDGLSFAFFTHRIKYLSYFSTNIVNLKIDWTPVW